MTKNETENELLFFLTTVLAVVLVYGLSSNFFFLVLGCDFVLISLALFLDTRYKSVKNK